MPKVIKLNVSIYINEEDPDYKHFLAQSVAQMNKDQAFCIGDFNSIVVNSKVVEERGEA